MITKEDRETLWTLWDNENPEDPEDTEWREHLNEEQAALVALWDRTWNNGLNNIARTWANLQARMKAAASS